MGKNTGGHFYTYAFLAGFLILFSAFAVGSTNKKTQKVPTPQAEDSVWVMRPDGAQSCSPEAGLTLAEGAQDLKSARIPVLDSRKGTDGKMHIQMCGAAKGSTNSFLIPKRHLKDAISLGYQEESPMIR
jgi:hypothetical protein